MWNKGRLFTSRPALCTTQAQPLLKANKNKRVRLQLGMLGICKFVAGFGALRSSSKKNM